MSAPRRGREVLLRWVGVRAEMDFVGRVWRFSGW